MNHNFEKMQVQIRFAGVLVCFEKTALAVFVPKTARAVFFPAARPHGLPVVVSSPGHQGNDDTRAC